MIPHSFTYLPDFGRTMASVGRRDDLSGTTWHVPSAPPVTGDELATELAILISNGNTEKL